MWGTEKNIPPLLGLRISSILLDITNCSLSPLPIYSSHRPHSHINRHPIAMVPMTTSRFPEPILLVRKNVAPLRMQSRSDLATVLLHIFPGSSTLLFSPLLKRAVHAYLYTNIPCPQNPRLLLKIKRAFKGTESRLLSG